MSLKELRRNWDRFGRRDPLWAIMAVPGKRGGRWRLEEFFSTGEDDIVGTMRYLRSVGAEPDHSRALDFGCGVGRLTRALADHFRKVDGVDIAPSMIRLAKKYNRRGAQCRFHLNNRADLAIFPTGAFSFVISIITLQHMEPALVKAYLAEFLRILVLGGILFFNMPSERTADPQPQTQTVEQEADKGPLAWAKRLAKSVAPPPLLRLYHGWTRPLEWEMHAIRRDELKAFLEQNGAEIVDVARTDFAGPQWIGYQYCVRRK